jgi:chain length determinant protein tyrosine kinase EpsG
MQKEAMRPRQAFEPVPPRLQPAGTGNIDDRTIGRILVDQGKLKPQDVARVFALHREKGVRFGEAARKLRLVSDEDVRHALSVQFNYPNLRPGQAALGAEVVVAHDPQAPQAEAIRDLRTQLLLEWLDAERKVLAVVSPDARDGRTYVAANLAVSFAQLGEPTLLIDADLREPRQHRIFAAASAIGLAHVLTGRAGLGAAEGVPYFDRLSVLCAGATPPNPLELLSRYEFARLVGEARQRYSVVVIDTPAAARGSDVKVVAARADGAIMIARRDRTRLADLDQLRRALTVSGAPLVGTVLNTL